MAIIDHVRPFAIVSIATIVLSAAAPFAAGEYPLTLSLEARAKTATTTITTTVTIRVDRLMEENRRKRVTDGLRYNGYQGAFTAMRALPPVGQITVESRQVDLKYAYETEDEKGRRLVLVADRPLFFLGNEKVKPRAGYELTVVELRFDAQGGVTGRMSGAARVKPTADGGVELSDYAENPVELTGHSK